MLQSVYIDVAINDPFHIDVSNAPELEFFRMLQMFVYSCRNHYQSMLCMRSRHVS
jgi:hypothetical protein